MTTPPPPSAPREIPLVDRLRAATAGRYDIHAELGVGGMATVFRATEIALEREVAIKVMATEVASSPGAFERFRREARVAAALSHTHIVPIYAIGEDPALAYFAMKYIEGRGLDEILRKEGAQPLDAVARIIGVVGRALHYAHGRGVVHRDVKPANIMIGNDGWVYVTDFGIAKREDAQGLTQAGTVIGTPAYMSPEQFNGHPVTGAADQYSLGIVAYEMLTGRAPFDGPSIGEVMRGHLFEAPPPIRTLRLDVPTGVADSVTRMLEKEPAQRFPTLDEAVSTLEATANAVKGIQKDLTKRPSVAPRARTASGATTRTGATGLSPQPVESASRGPSAVGVLLVLALLAGGGWFALRDRSTSAVPLESAPEAAASGPDTASGVGVVPGSPMTTDPAAASAPSPTDPLANSAADSARRQLSLDSAFAAFGARIAAAPIVEAIALEDSAIVRLGSGTPETVLFVNGRQLGIIGLRGIIPVTLAPGSVSLSVRRINCRDWDTTFTARAGRQYTLGERSPVCGRDSVP